MLQCILAWEVSKEILKKNNAVLVNFVVEFYWTIQFNEIAYLSHYQVLTTR
jgi:hypothetical protein